jgi:hypothetical protein
LLTCFGLPPDRAAADQVDLGGGRGQGAALEHAEDEQVGDALRRLGLERNDFDVHAGILRKPWASVHVAGRATAHRLIDSRGPALRASQRPAV